MTVSVAVRPIRTGFVSFIALAVLVAGVIQAQTVPFPKYPPTTRGAQSDDLNGVRVADPYRWLENVTSPEVHAWVTAQNAVTQAYLAQIPRRNEIASQLAQAWAYSKVSAPFAAGERL